LASPSYYLPVRNWHHLAWALLMMDGIRRGGIEEVDSLRFHRLQFFSNSLAPIYGQRPPIELVMKLERGPFYPDAQDDIDTLAISGLVGIRDVKWHQKGDRVWKTASYALTAEGFEFAKRLTAESLWCEGVGAFLHDLALAYSDLGDAVLDSLALRDLTYAQDGVSIGDIIPFKAEGNLSVRATGAMASMLPASFRPNRRNQLRIYLKYLEGLAA
jgi:hypothetical protein